MSVFGLCLLEQQQVRVGLLPKREQVLIGNAGSSLVAAEGEGARELQLSERDHGRSLRHSTVSQYLLEFGRRLGSLSSFQIGHAADVNRHHGADVLAAEFIGSGNF